MYIYSVTVSIDKLVADEWHQWMKTIHIPMVMETGYFTEYKMCKVLNVDDEGATYSTQYSFNDMKDIESYMALEAPRLQTDMKALYDGKYVAFRTLLEIV
ncbi:MAG: DUF4286 family protein [Burkholderiales bacterium]|nr:DUF4286 family protein [Bacteroidia bacterium]